MYKLDLREILEQTSKSVNNGHTLEQLEEWKVLLKKLDSREDKNSLKNAISILEQVIKLKKKKNKTSGELFKQAFLFLLFTFMLVGVYASITHNIQSSPKLIVGDNVSIFLSDVNIDNNTLLDINSLNFTRGHEILGSDSLIITTGFNKTFRAFFGAEAGFPQTMAAQMSSIGFPLGLDNKTIAFLGSVVNVDDINSFSRFSEINLNNGSSAVAGFLARNDVGKTVSLGITSSTFAIQNDSLPNVPTIFANSSGTFAFVNLFKTGWRFRVDQNNATGSFDFLEVMEIDAIGNVEITGNFTSDQIQLRSVEPRHTCNDTSKGTIIYEGNGTSGDFFGCKQLNIGSFVWRKLS